MSKPTVEEILTSKPEARPRIYAYSIDDKAHTGLLKVGQTTRNVKERVAEQLPILACWGGGSPVCAWVLLDFKSTGRAPFARRFCA
jgi:hypothetical protein